MSILHALVRNTYILSTKRNMMCNYDNEYLNLILCHFNLIIHINAIIIIVLQSIYDFILFFLRFKRYNYYCSNNDKHILCVLG